MIKVTKQWFSSLTMTKQIGLYQSMILIVVIVLLIVLFEIQLGFILPLLKFNQNRMFLHMSQQRLDSVLQYHKLMITGILELNANQLIGIHQLVLASQTQNFTDQYLEYDYIGNTMFPDSLQVQQREIPTPYTYSFMCSSNQSAFNNQSNNIIGFSNLIGSMGTMLNTQTLGVNSLFYGALQTNPIIVYNYPCVNIGNLFKYLPTLKRPWYTKAKSEYQLNQDTKYRVKLTDPFVYTITNGIDISMTIPQVDINNTFIGAWAINFQPSTFIKYVQQNNIVDMILLVDRNGILLVHNFDNHDMILPLYIHNTTVTGYEIDDWNLIKHNDTSSNNCDPDYQLNGYVCRYNALLNKDLHIFTAYIHQYEIYVIFLSDQSIIKYSIADDNEQITQFIEKTLILTIYYSFAVFGLILCAVSIILAFTIQRPINKVIQLIKHTLKPFLKEKHFRKITLLSSFKSCQIQQLLIAFNRLLSKFTKSQMTKCEDCQLYEKFKFPMTEQLQEDYRLLRVIQFKQFPEQNTTQDWQNYQALFPHNDEFQ